MPVVIQLEGAVTGRIRVVVTESRDAHWTGETSRFADISVGATAYQLAGVHVLRGGAWELIELHGRISDSADAQAIDSAVTDGLNSALGPGVDERTGAERRRILARIRKLEAQRAARREEIRDEIQKIDAEIAAGEAALEALP